MSTQVRGRGQLVAAVVVIAVVVFAAGCGSDTDESASTTEPTSAEPTTTTVPESGDALCMAYLHLENAQDGAQRNVALGDMRSSAGGDPAILEALDVLDAADQDAGATVAASTALRRSVRDACGSAAVCEAWTAFETAEDGAQRNTALGDLRTLLDDPGVVSALDVLDAGDTDPADVTGASDQVSTYLDPLCGDG